ncbi:hypothetical protein, partial [Paenibacillus sp. UNC451MF]|uniref:hypothetical protein n=1 Tax=Paenibacillus sp. UNC451MF TaxID=1449063 RepID=UPI000564B897
GNFSFLVRQEGEARYVTIFSKEKTSERPHLVLQTYSLEEDKPPVEGISARVSGTDSVQVGETFDVEYGLTGVAGKQKLRH